MRRCEHEPTLAEVVADIRNVHVILTEGYKRGDAPKIEVSRRGQGDQRTRGQGDGGARGGYQEAGGRSWDSLCTAEELVAVVSDQRFDVDVPQFDLEGVTGLADLIEARFLQRE